MHFNAKHLTKFQKLYTVNSLVNDQPWKVEIRAILYCISYNHFDHARWTLTGNRICQMSGLKSGRSCEAI